MEIIEYINYKGDSYYLHQGTTNKGNPKYWFSRKAEGDLVHIIPQGFEIYEEPNGMVYVRKIQPKLIKDHEINIIRRSIPKGLLAKLDLKKNIVTLFLSEESYSLYQAMMRFILIDEETREFEAQRYCFRGAIDDWIYLEISDDLKELATKCCFHLGKDSFYDLPYMVEGFK